MRELLVGYEELGAVGVGSLVCHPDQPPRVELERLDNLVLGSAHTRKRTDEGT